MASVPSSSSDTPAETPEKLETADSNETTQNVQYDESAKLRLSKQQPEGKLKFWKKFRGGQKSDWWFASTGIPLLAATLGPLANVTSIAALVTSWREYVYVEGLSVPEFEGVPFADPNWCYWLNVASLICGFLGNLFLLLNFTQRIRYIIALPVTIIFWYLSTGFLIGITACMQVYDPPNRPYETYTQGFWYAIAAAVFYLICSMLLMINMLGHFLGHYPDHFALTDAQRTLILQTMLFFIWLGGGAAVFSRIETDRGETGWEFADALYFCDVTILTVGFGDLYPTSDLGRGIVFPYSVGGIIMLGLVISSIYKFMRQIGEDHIIQAHIDRMRERTMERTVTSSFDLRRREHEHHLMRHNTSSSAPRLEISGPSNGRAYRTAMGNSVRRMAPSIPNPIRRNKKPRLLLLREEKDRFDAMRKIQTQTHKFKSWYALIFSVGAFGILWCVGAVVFWQTEKDAQDMTYFRALYFCYISLLTIGYGDLSPKTNAGRCFFVVWSLIAVPTMTILVSDMGDTVIHKFKIWSSELADFTVLPKEGIWRSFLDKHPWLLIWIQTLVDKRAAKKRLKAGFKTTDPNATISPNEVDDTEAAEVNEIETQFLNTVKPTSNLQTIMHAAPLDLNPGTLRTHLAVSIRLVATDMRLHTLKKYCYEEWVEFTRLLRYSSNHTCADDVAAQEEEEGLVDWDYLGEDSPLISGGGESEWLLQRLTEALVRVERRVEHRVEMRVGREKEKDISRTGEGNDDEQIERTVDIEGEISEATRRGTEMEGDCLRKRDEEVESEELRRRRIEH